MESNMNLKSSIYSKLNTKSNIIYDYINLEHWFADVYLLFIVQNKKTLIIYSIDSSSQINQILNKNFDFSIYLTGIFFKESDIISLSGLTYNKETDKEYNFSLYSLILSSCSC